MPKPPGIDASAVLGKNFVLLRLRLCFCYGCYWLHGDQRLRARLAEFHKAVAYCIDGKIFSKTYTFAGMEFCAALTYDDVAINGRLTAKDLYTKSFRLRVAVIFYRAFTFFVCHCLKLFLIYDL